jgi:nitrogen fixation protein FixH
MKALVVAVCLVGLAAVAGPIVVGMRTFEGTVVEHPYERGLAWDGELARRRESGLEVRLANTTYGTGTARVALSIGGAAAGGVGDGDVAVRVRRPETAEHERTVPARRHADGAWAAEVPLPVPGRWELAVLVERPGGRIDFPFAIAVGAGAAGAADSAECDLNRGPCRRQLPGGGSLTLEIAPWPVRTMRELEFTVRLACAKPPCAVTGVSVSLTMPGMYMGENSVVLAPAQEPGFYRGRGTIVRCPSGRSLWQAKVQAPPLGEAAFTFATDRP